MIKKILEVHIGSEFDHGPEVAVVEITTTLDARIRQLAAAAKVLGVYKVSEFNSSPDFFLRDYDAVENDGPIAYRTPEDEEEGNTCRAECVTLNVTADDYYWSGYVKHTNIRWETDTVPLGLVESNDLMNRHHLPQTPLSFLRTIEASLVIGSMRESEIQKVALSEVQRILNRPAPYLGIVLQGGIVQAIISDQPELMADWKVMVIDYDTESTPDEDLVSVPQSDGSDSKAWVYLDSVTQIAIDLKAVYAALSRSSIP
jgi:hypothetical protein